MRRYQFRLRLTGLLSICLFIVLFSGCGKELSVLRLSYRTMVISYSNLNMAAISTQKGIVVIDTLDNPRMARKARKLIENEFPGQKFVYVINTHGHYDHTFGNQVFAEAEIVGHRNCHLWMSRSAGDDFLGRKIQKESKYNGFVLSPPSRTFEDRMELDLGDMKFQLIYFGISHSNSDIMIKVPEEGLLFVGDLFFRHGFPNFKTYRGHWYPGEWEVPRWIHTLDTVLSGKRVEYVVPGHGELIPPKHLAHWKRYFKELWSGMKRVKKQGLGYDQVLRRFSLGRRFKFFNDMGFTEPPEGYHKRIMEEFAKILKIN